MSYEEISAELDQKFTELGQNFGRVRPKIGPELGVKFWKKTLPPGHSGFKTKHHVSSSDAGQIANDFLHKRCVFVP